MFLSSRKKDLFWLAALFAAGVLMLSPTSAKAEAAAAEGEGAQKPIEITWVVAHEPVQYFEATLKTFEESLRRQLGGEMPFKINAVKPDDYIKASGAYQHETVLNKTFMKELQDGKIHVAQIYTGTLAAYNPAFYVYDLPFIFQDDAHIDRVYESEAGQELLASLDQHGIKGLAYAYSGGLQSIISVSGKEIKSPEDLKGVNYRENPSPVKKRTAEFFGANVYDINTVRLGDRIKVSDDPEEYAVIDAMSATDSNLYYQYGVKADTVENPQNFVWNKTDDAFIGSVLSVNKDFFEGLPENLQTAFAQAMHDAAIMERRMIINDGAKNRANLQKAGHTYVEWSVGQRAEYKKQVAPIYTEFKSMIGEDLIAKVEAMGESSHGSLEPASGSELMRKAEK